jgi:uncharacterized membrane protein YbhN (UPF0104 family)
MGMALIPAVDVASSFDSFFNAADRFFSNLAAIGWGAFALALLLYLGMLLARTRAWQNVLRAAYPKTPVRYIPITGAYLVGAGLNGIIPARIGDAVKILLSHRAVPGSSYPALTSSFLVQTVFDTTVGVIVFGYAISQGLLPRPPELPDIPAFEISFWAQHPRIFVFFLTSLAVGTVAAFILFAHRADAFWNRVKQGVVILTDPPRYLREVASWQTVAWLFRFGSFWFFLEAFNVGGSFQNVLLVMSVQAVSTMLPFTPGGAGAQQALLVATLTGASGAAVLSYSVGQQIAIAAWAALLGFLALLLIFRTTDWRGLMRAAEAESAKATSTS